MCVCVCVCVPMYVYMCVKCVYICMCVHIYIYLCISIYVYMKTLIERESSEWMGIPWRWMSDVIIFTMGFIWLIQKGVNQIEVKLTYTYSHSLKIKNLASFVLHTFSSSVLVMLKCVPLTTVCMTNLSRIDKQLPPLILTSPTSGQIRNVFTPIEVEIINHIKQFFIHSYKIGL